MNYSATLVNSLVEWQQEFTSSWVRSPEGRPTAGLRGASGGQASSPWQCGRHLLNSHRGGISQAPSRMMEPAEITQRKLKTKIIHYYVHNKSAVSINAQTLGTLFSITPLLLHTCTCTVTGFFLQLTKKTTRICLHFAHLLNLTCTYTCNKH